MGTYLSSGGRVNTSAEPIIKILWIDGSTSLREKRAAELRSSGYEVVTSPSVAQAALSWVSARADLAVFVMSGRNDGEQALCRTMRFRKPRQIVGFFYPDRQCPLFFEGRLVLQQRPADELMKSVQRMLDE
jgi:hypothetical protein